MPLRRENAGAPGVGHSSAHQRERQGGRHYAVLHKNSKLETGVSHDFSL